MVTESVNPNLGKLLEGMRSVDYTFSVSIADLIDNSIEAGATAVNVQVKFVPEDGVHVSISDNGSGMDRNSLIEGMRFGADNSDDDHRLGKFGLGMKTASIGFCKRLVVASKCESQNSPISATWDLDELAESNTWDLEVGEPPHHISDIYLEEAEFLAQLSGQSTDSGTLVVWENVDRVLIKPDGEQYRDPIIGIKNKIKSLQSHISLVFHRFLDPEDNRARNIQITINGEKQEAHDPFYRSLDLRPPVQHKDWLLEHTIDGGSPKEGKIQLTGFIFPHPRTISDAEHAKMIKKAIGVEKQGIYFYRENRLIDGPVWVGGLGRETHLNRLRVEFDYESTIDHLFTVDIKKKNILIHDQILDELVDELIPLRRQADKESREPVDNITDPLNGPSAANTSIKEKEGSLVTPDLVADGKKVTMTNNTTAGNEQLVLTDLNGAPNTDIGVAISSGPKEEYVGYEVSTLNASLWEPALIPGEKNIRVIINRRNNWFLKTLQQYAANDPLLTAFEFLFYALAQAEMNNIHEDHAHIFEDFRVEVTRNLNRLVSDLPDPAEND